MNSDIKIGQAYFKEGTNIKQHKSFNFNLKQWHIYRQCPQNKLYNNFKVSLFAPMSQADVEILYIYNQQNPNQLRFIIHIKFNLLKKLKITGDNVANIQIIVLLQCQKLKELYLIKNCITNYQSLRKLKTPLLRILYLMNDVRGQVSKLREYDIKCLQDFRESGTGNPMCEDIMSGLAAWRSWIFLYTSYQRKNMICSSKKVKMLRIKCGLYGYKA